MCVYIHTHAYTHAHTHTNVHKYARVRTDTRFHACSAAPGTKQAPESPKYMANY